MQRIMKNNQLEEQITALGSPRKEEAVDGTPQNSLPEERKDLDTASSVALDHDELEAQFQSLMEDWGGEAKVRQMDETLGRFDEIQKQLEEIAKKASEDE